MRDVYVAGAAMTRFGKFPDTTIRALAEEATRGALDDAGVAPPTSAWCSSPTL